MPEIFGFSFGKGKKDEPKPQVPTFVEEWQREARENQNEIVAQMMAIEQRLQELRHQLTQTRIPSTESNAILAEIHSLEEQKASLAFNGANNAQVISGRRNRWGI